MIKLDTTIDPPSTAIGKNTMDLSKLFSLHGKVAIVTGASRGIGYCIAEFLAAAGAAVVISSRCQEELEMQADELNRKGYSVRGIACDVGKAEDLEQLVAKTIALFGQLDILVNNVGINPVYGRIHELDIADFDRLMNINVKAPFLLSKLCMPYLMESSNASIINIGAAEGLKPEPKLALYSISNAALISLSKAFAKEWGNYQIRVNVVCPGMTKTEFNEVMWSNDRIMMERMKNLSLKRMCENEEVAAMVLFLASPASTYTTGTVMAVDGGFHI
jgi:dehydrogenase/reductase SDR family protein 4